MGLRCSGYVPKMGGVVKTNNQIGFQAAATHRRPGLDPGSRTRPECGPMALSVALRGGCTVKPSGSIHLGNEVFHHWHDFIGRPKTHRSIHPVPACPCLAVIEAEHDAAAVVPGPCLPKRACSCSSEEPHDDHDRYRVGQEGRSNRDRVPIEVQHVGCAHQGRIADKRAPNGARQSKPPPAQDRS